MGNFDLQVKEIQQKYQIIGRSAELKNILIAYYAKKHILIEGEIGTGKTALAHAFASYMDKKFFRVDGSEDILSHVMVGFFDPPIVLSSGYVEEAFLYGPLSQSMKNGGVLFINELNRLPESTQNVLLSALDEGYLDVPKLPAIESKNGFIAITTMNPSAHVAVTHLGEALKDRFVWIKVDYQTEEEEFEIIKQKIEKLMLSGSLKTDSSELTEISEIATKIIRLTREHKDLRRGCSIRGGIDLASLVLTYSARGVSIKKDPAFWFNAAIMALSTKIELEDGADTTIEAVIHEIVKSVLQDF